MRSAERTSCPTKPTITGAMVHAARILAGHTQAELSDASGIRRQTISRMEACGPNPIASRDRNVVPVLAALGRHGVMMQLRGVALVQNKTPAECAQQGLADKGAR